MLTNSYCNYWAMRVTHLPSGQQVQTSDRFFRSHHKAKLSLLRRIRAMVAHPCDASLEVRTYDFCSGVTTDHRTGDQSPLPIPPSCSLDIIDAIVAILEKDKP